MISSLVQDPVLKVLHIWSFVIRLQKFADENDCEFVAM